MTRHHPVILPLNGLQPRIPASAFVAPTAVVVADVRLGEHSSVWFHSVLRGDLNYVSVGDYTNIQDACVLHVEDDRPCIVGAYCTVGHGAILHACTVGDGCLIGMGATLLSGSEIGAGSIVGAGSLVREGQRIAPGSLVVGMPAQLARQLTDEEARHLRQWAEKYARKAAEYLEALRGSAAS